MSEPVHPQARRLYDSLRRHGGEEAAALVPPLAKTPAPNKAFAWAEAACAALEARFSPEEIQKIRKDCACGPAQGRMDAMRRLWERSADLDDFTARFNASKQGAEMWTEGGDLYFAYPACYCSCVNKVDAPLPRTWCLCTLGYTERMFSYAFDRPMRAELLESVKTGGRRCVLRVRPA